MTRAQAIMVAADLARLRSSTDLDEVMVDARRLKYRGLLPCALRYALWAVRPGGRIVVHDDGRHDASAPIFEVPFNSVRQWAMKFVARDAELVRFDAAGLLEFERSAPVLEPGWSAGVVYSGRDEELPSLRRCLAGLAAQPELSSQRGGEIVVCGPERDLGFLAEFPQVRYLPYEAPAGHRFLIGHKKNALIRALRGPRIAIVHARIVFDAGALSGVPREFDILAPNIAVMEGGRRTPYLSIGRSDAAWPGLMPRRLPLTMRNLGSGDALALHRHGGVFVDGGAFLVTRRVHEACPLDEALAWEEGEDLEWCARAHLHGYLSDFAPGCTALSQAGSRLRRRPRLGVLTRGAEFVVRRARWVRAATRHHWLTLTGYR